MSSISSEKEVSEAVSRPSEKSPVLLVSISEENSVPKSSHI